jgi:hypothetical protein
MSGKRLVFVAVVLFFCTAPIYDRAEIKPGPAFTVGAGLGTGVAPARSPTIWDPPVGLPSYGHYFDGIGTLRVSYGFSRKVALVLDGSLGYGTWIGNPDEGEGWKPLKPWMYDLTLGLKIRTGRRGALVPAIGTGILELVYLHDLNRFYSLNFGAGLRGISAGINRSIYLNRHWTLLAGGRLVTGWEWLLTPVYIPQLSAGVALQYRLKE